MKNRKFVKLRVDMYSDTKFKIIDTMEDRDIIHYIWTRLITLCGQINLNGDLYMSKTIPYTADTLAIEFNRSVEKVKLALKVFMDLEMIEISKDNVYKISNFVKHQNIKVKEGIDKKEEPDNEELNMKNQKKSKSSSENIIEEVKACTVNSNLKEKDRDNKSINGRKKLKEDNKDKVFDFKDKCSDLISLEGSNCINTDRKKRVRRSKKKDTEIEYISSDEIEADGDQVWSYGNISEEDVIEAFTF